MDEQQQASPEQQVAQDPVLPATPAIAEAGGTVAPIEQAPAPRRRNWQGALGVGTALVLAFVWGGIADRQLAPMTKGARILPVVAANAAVAGAEAPPGWISDFAKAFCEGDAQTIAPRIGPPLTNNVEAISNALSDRDWQCNDIRFTGGGQNPKGSFYMYVTRDKQDAEQWWVFTVVGEQVVAID